MFYKKVDLHSNRAMFDFLTGHFTYDTMNSWNGLRSIAHNVKLYNLPGIDYAEASQALEEDQYETINQTIRDWEDEHEGYEVGFNGRSGGYLVLYSKNHHDHVFNSDSYSPCGYINSKNGYEDWKEDVRRDWGSLKAYQPSLIKQVQLVQEFDKLCDDLIEVLKELIKDMKDRHNRTHEFEATLRFQRYYYPTLKDMQYHMLQMKQRGYSVYECDKNDLWAEYEMNEAIHSQVTVEEEGDEEFVC